MPLRPRLLSPQDALAHVETLGLNEQARLVRRVWAVLGLMLAGGAVTLATGWLPVLVGTTLAGGATLWHEKRRLDRGLRRHPRWLRTGLERWVWAQPDREAALVAMRAVDGPEDWWPLTELVSRRVRKRLAKRGGAGRGNRG